MSHTLFNTLAQKGTKKVENSCKKLPVIVSGHGSDISCKHKTNARTKKKTISQKVILSLIDVAKNLEDEESVKSYWNTYHCLERIICSDGKLFGKYCKSRICNICSANRKAELIKKYYPTLSQWKEAYFVTLTLKSVPASRLNAMMRNVKKGFSRIIDKYKKKSQRDNHFRLMGIKSLECNFNPIKRTYNPHFHIIVPDEKTADILISEWLYYSNRKGSKWAGKACQNKSKIKDIEVSMKEVIKYGSKLLTDPSMKKFKDKSVKPVIYSKALHNILIAMKGLRLFDKFGFTPQKAVKGPKERPKLLKEYDEMIFDPERMNWVDTESDLALSDYILPDELLEVLNMGIDREKY